MEKINKNFRQFITSTGKEVLAGKNADSNEDLVKQIKNNELVFHTAKPGSPFVNIKAPESEVNEEEIKEVAVFCAKYSQDWRDNKKDVIVHIFSGREIGKEKGMPLGTFGVKHFKQLKIKKSDILELESKLQKEVMNNN